MADEKTNMNDIASEQDENVPAVTGIGLNVPTGLSGSDPAVQSKINDIMKLRAGDYGRSAIMGAAAGAQAGQGAGSPLNAFIQGMAAGLQAPAQIYQAKKAQVQSVLDATPFSATHPEIAKQPGYNILASLPTKIALQAISQIAQDAAKVNEEHNARMAEQSNAAKKEVITDPGELESYSKLTGLPKEYIQKVRKDDVMAFAKAQGEGAGKVNEDLLKLKTAFDTRPAVSSWNAVKPETNTIDSLGRILASKGALTPQEQLQLSLSFKAIAASAGGAGRMTEDTLAIVENKGNWGQLVDKLTSGAAVTLTPEEARDVINASHVKVNQIKAGYVDEKSKWDKTILKDNQQAKDFLYDNSASKDSSDVSIAHKPGDLISTRGKDGIETWEVQPDGVTTKRIQ